MHQARLTPRNVLLKGQGIDLGKQTQMMMGKTAYVAKTTHFPFLLSQPNT